MKTKTEKFKYLFGPVRSRRLGLSLGIDLIPFKTCTFDCVYCECGHTTVKTAVRKPYVSADEIISELDRYLVDRPQVDYLTFSGSGEPLLNSETGKIISYLKKNHPGYKIALITNSFFMGDDSVRKEIAAVDLIVPSLDAVSPGIFGKIDKPVEKADVNAIINGLVEFRKISKAAMWLEIFFVPGINDTPEEIEKLKQAAMKIKPDRVQINSLDRPGADKTVTSLTAEGLAKIKQLFLPLETEIISRKLSKTGENGAGAKSGMNDAEEAILSTIIRRPMTLDDIAAMPGMPAKTVIMDILNQKIRENLLEKEDRSGLEFFKIKK